ncbi:Y-family DNA polymerase [Halotalea alkalilenta]|uniref:DNA repair nucleotidyltransferase n=1 Tax=Halotalea alkalilenta TaxID=376489 RepID=A0A172YHG2_9GAMM|nr:DNA polymerase Y family protein [Halotalea alkalilenta]ANF58637.1 DNA repair nucleotidyltransferase [Halotalea alkalilenta]
MRWACILLPRLALDGVLRRHPDPEAPLALITGASQRRVLHAVNPSARALGLRAGQSLTAAQALSRDFTIHGYDPRDAERWQRLLAAWAYRYSSQVSLHYPRALLVEIASSLALFGPWPRFEARLREELAALGFTHRINVAPNPAAARVLGNAHDGLAVASQEALKDVLGALPVERAGLPRDAVEALSRMGLRRLDQVLALPRATLTRRFAPEVIRHLGELLGEWPLALESYLPPDEFDLRLELNFEVSSHQALLFPLRRLIGDLAAFLAGRDSGVQRFTLELEHVKGAPSLVPVGLLGAERDPGLLFELARGRLERTRVGAPVRAVRLTARELPPFAPERRELFDARPQQSQPWEQLRERLRARLGDHAVHGLGTVGDHRPECAWQPAFLSSAQLDGARLRPGWLLARPIPFDVEVAGILAGPERIESGWWDGGDVRRDYYLIETRKGQRGWVYREVGGDGHYWLQGWFG